MLIRTLTALVTACVFGCNYQPPPCEPADPGPQAPDGVGYLDMDGYKCSAALVDDHATVLTAAHCNVTETGVFVVGDKETEADRVWVDPSRDVALWRLSSALRDVEPLAMSSAQGDGPYAIHGNGCHDGYFGSREFKSADFSRISYSETCVCDGDSGGPVTNEYGDVVAVVGGPRVRVDALGSDDWFVRVAHVRKAIEWLSSQ